LLSGTRRLEVTFRDDREVLKQRARDLENSLAEAERELEQRRDAVAHAAKLEVELAQARDLLRRSEILVPARPSPESSRAAGVSIALVLGFSAMAGMFVVRGTSNKRPSYVPAPILRMPPALSAGITDAPFIASPVPIRPATADEPAEVKARFSGKVKQASGMKLPAGTDCELTAVLRSNENHEVTIRCGRHELYSSTHLLEGMAQLSSEARQIDGAKPDYAQATLVWHDVGTRTGLRTQAAVDSQQRVAIAWRDSHPAYRVEIDIEPRSAPYRGSFLPRLSTHAH
jgi:hypothetical protein